MRAISGVNTSAITRMTTRLLAPTAVMMVRARTTSGSARKASSTRAIDSSMNPRKYPMTRPSADPSTVLRITASGAMMRMLRAPVITRESMSRPS